jgi:hypothetical protein
MLLRTFYLQQQDSDLVSYDVRFSEVSGDDSGRFLRLEFAIGNDHQDFSSWMVRWSNVTCVKAATGCDRDASRTSFKGLVHILPLNLPLRDHLDAKVAHFDRERATAGHQQCIAGIIVLETFDDRVKGHPRGLLSMCMFLATNLGGSCKVTHAGHSSVSFWYTYQWPQSALDPHRCTIAFDCSSFNLDCFGNIVQQHCLLPVPWSSPRCRLPTSSPTDDSIRGPRLTTISRSVQNGNNRRRGISRRGSSAIEDLDNP